MRGQLHAEIQPGEILPRLRQENAPPYDAFYAKFGTINSSANARVFDEDSSYYLLCSLENIDEDGRLESKADMLTCCKPVMRWLRSGVMSCWTDWRLGNIPLTLYAPRQMVI